ncbi:hypothetical protein [Geobacter sp. SVR]|uniref:hypothetical protein n=1 Tax=Geobacter sp. SVR TaxID=2495594 RepID=UPI00143EFEBF|nr:hypothetical protein [Geobacter sp. SVR]BCS52738.1 hypothetical protein GSVR_10460 [Geobacter sp. SVR]GCF86766.1 hypothetical protein GSbR_33660 [Geobacter sp. SVR]
MVRSRIRIIPFMILMTMLLAVSGIASTASALISHDSADMCCDSEKKDDAETPSPCSTPECGCIACQNAIVAAGTPAIAAPFAPDIPHPDSLQHYHPREYIASIEYPPETR